MCVEPGSWEQQRGPGGGWCGKARWREGQCAHLIQHGVSLGPLPLPEQHEASDDVRGHNVKVSKKLSKEVGNF